MIKLEQVTYGLDCCSWGVKCSFCPYKDEPECKTVLMCDALDLLEAQKMPKVMTEDDVLHPTGKPLWFESRGMYLGQKGFWCLLFEIDSKFHVSFVQSITGGKITLSLFDYGKVWRFWTAQPTEE